MRICDVVMNSIWFDPRVIRQIHSYNEQSDIELVCVGVKDSRYDAEKLREYTFPIKFAETPRKYQGKLKSPVSKILREKAVSNSVFELIMSFRPDIIHANDLDALIPAMKAARKLKCRVVYDSHEVFVENNNVVKYPLYSKFLRKIEQKLVKKCDLMICVSNAAADYFAKIYNIKKPIVITNCALKSAIQYENREKNHCFEVINHGLYYAGRGYDIMAQACELFEQYPDINLAIRGYGKMEEELRQIVEKANNKHQFVFYPPVSVQDLIPLASKSSVGVAITVPYCLNFELSVSNKIFEYAAAGLPVIMSNIPEHKYLNQTYNFGIVLDEITPKAFADAVIKLYKNKELYSELSQNAIAMSEKLNWDNEFSKLISIERELVQSYVKG